MPLQVLIKPKPIFQTAVVSEQTRQLVSETLQQASRVADAGPAYAQERALKDESGAIAEGRSPPAEGSHGSGHGTLHHSTSQSKKSVI